MIPQNNPSDFLIFFHNWKLFKVICFLHVIISSFLIPIYRQFTTFFTIRFVQRHFRKSSITKWLFLWLYTKSKELGRSLEHQIEDLSFHKNCTFLFKASLNETRCKTPWAKLVQNHKTYLMVSLDAIPVNKWSVGSNSL